MIGGESSYWGTMWRKERGDHSVGSIAVIVTLLGSNRSLDTEPIAIVVEIASVLTRES